MSSWEGFVAAIGRLLTLQLCKVAVELMHIQVVMFNFW